MYCYICFHVCLCMLSKFLLSISSSNNKLLMLCYVLYWIQYLFITQHLYVWLCYYIYILKSNWQASVPLFHLKIVRNHIKNTYLQDVLEQYSRNLQSKSLQMVRERERFDCNVFHTMLKRFAHTVKSFVKLLHMGTVHWWATAFNCCISISYTLGMAQPNSSWSIFSSCLYGKKLSDHQAHVKKELEVLNKIL